MTKPVLQRKHINSPNCRCFTVMLTWEMKYPASLYFHFIYNPNSQNFIFQLSSFSWNAFTSNQNFKKKYHDKLTVKVLYFCTLYLKQCSYFIEKIIIFITFFYFINCSKYSIYTFSVYHFSHRHTYLHIFFMDDMKIDWSPCSYIFTQT